MEGSYSFNIPRYLHLKIIYKAIPGLRCIASKYPGLKLTAMLLVCQFVNPNSLSRANFFFANPKYKCLKYCTFTTFKFNELYYNMKSDCLIKIPTAVFRYIRRKSNFRYKLDCTKCW